jgi:hypothetical protein
MAKYYMFYTRLMREEIEADTPAAAKIAAENSMAFKGSMCKILALRPVEADPETQDIPDAARLKKLLARRIKLPEFK